MSARLLLATFDTIYMLALTAWAGSVVFFSFGVAPIIFKVLGAEWGGKFVRSLFPRYYAWGATAGAIALAALVCGPLSVPELRGPSVGVQASLIVGCILIMLYCGNTLTPAINTARDAGAEGKARFERLHRRSLRLNSLVLVVSVGLVAAFALRPSPTTLGIVEPTPAERVRHEEELLRKIRTENAAEPNVGPAAGHLPEARSR